MILVGSYTSGKKYGIYHLDIDSDGKFKLFDNYYSGDNPSFLLTIGKNTLAVNETCEKKNISVFSTLNFSIKETLESHGEGPCHLLNIDDYIIVSNYSDGSLSLLKMVNNSIVFCDYIKHKGRGPNSARQESAHVHSTVFDKSNGIIYCMDLGIDKIISYKITNDNKLVKYGSFNLNPGDGPRMMVIDSYKHIGYIVNELSNTVNVVNINKNGKISTINRVSTLPESFNGVSLASHIEIRGNKLTVSNRGYDSLVTFTIEENNLSDPIWTDTMGSFPRHFSYCNNDDFIIVANQESNSISSFRIVKGYPKYTGNTFSITLPTMILNID